MKVRFAKIQRLYSDRPVGDEIVKKEMGLKWINTGAFAAMILVNALANVLSIGGNTTGQVSAAYPNLFTPAPVTFAIWGVIYLLMAVFVIYQWGFLDEGVHSTKVRQDIGLWFAVSCVLNILWILLWHFRLIGLSTICIVLLLVTLILIQGRLISVGGNFLQRMAAKAGFSIYYGWIIAATIANIVVFLTQVGWNGWGLPEGFWTSALLLIGGILASAVVLIGGNRLAGLAVMWAFAGILLKHLSPEYYGGSHPLVITAGFLSEIIILISILLPQIEKFMVRPGSVAKRKAEE